MDLNKLTAISPVDGRYRDKAEALDGYFSEYALIKYRVMVEVEYFIKLCELPLPQLKDIDKKEFSSLRKIYQDFSVDDAARVKEIEKTINHDVKSVEYFLKEIFDKEGLSEYKEMIHFGLTSQDINNTAVPLSLKDAISNVYKPLLFDIVHALQSFSYKNKNVSMLARTHGQPASPTKLGKEIKVFIDRINGQFNQLEKTPYSAKFGGATGNFNAHQVAYPEVNWVEFGDELLNDTLGLARSKVTTQIEHYDNMAALFDAMKRINTILIDFARDCWTYISLEYFKQKVNKQEVGSSTMPHKVNPIDFENAEGNLGVANAFFNHLADKLPVSRLQRDLTDSTVLRNVGVPFAHSVIAFKSLLKGLDKVTVNKKAIDKDLDNNWSVVAEAIQSVLRREGYPKPYEALKELTRKGEGINKETIKAFIDKLDVSDKVKNELNKITPFNYTGVDLV